ncbi:MAG: hypothetical protein M1828_005199 [Chrysothrix sp. TS-e1954]|nr:MAG: hypothetical protein M1828_005199 [Chrysothrix sp. TS-e1954]
MFVLLFQCNPPQKAWNPTVSGECNVATSGKGLDFNYFISAWQAATDLCITFYPLLIIWGLNITTRMKISLSLLMSVSLFAFASCTVKTIEQRHFNDRGDLTYLFAPVPIWDAADLWVFLTVTSIPPLWPFFRFYFARATAKIHGRDVNEAGAGAIQMSLYKGGRGKGATATKVDNRGFPLKKVDSEDSDTYAYFLPQDGIVMTTEIAVDQEERRKSQFRKSQRRGLPRSPFSTDSVIMAGGGGIHGAQNTTKAEFTGEAVRDKI